MAIELVTRPCKPRAEIIHRARGQWYVRGARDEFADGVPYWLDLGTCWTERRAESRARRWLRRAVREQGWQESRRTVEL